MTNYSPVSGFLSTHSKAVPRGTSGLQSNSERKAEGLVPRASLLCQMCGVCFTRGRMAQSATVTERHTPLISFLWDAWMQICFKSSPSPLLLDSFILIASTLLLFHQSFHLLSCKSKTFFFFNTFLNKILSLQLCLSISPSLFHPSIHPSLNVFLSRISRLLYPSSSFPTRQMKQSQLCSHFTGGRTDHTITIIDYIKRRWWWWWWRRVAD